jgi:hypothetical protein
MVLSLAFFLFASAFTLAPERSANDIAEGVTIELVEETAPALSMSDCKTCTFGSSGPNGCKSASFCGLTECEGNCDQSGGDLCGECAGCSDPTVPCQA